MSFYPRPCSFILVASDHGPLIVNRNDWHKAPNQTFGLSYQIFENSSYDRADIEALRNLLTNRQTFFGQKVIMVDCGANIGVMTVECAKHLTGWGFVIGIEAQERLFYALAGNIALNNCLNAKIIHAALSDEVGDMSIPIINYDIPTCFGAVELIKLENPEQIGQELDYNPENMAVIRKITLDSCKFSRVDLIKLDIEGMELFALNGAVETLKKHKPILWIEQFKAGAQKLRDFLEPFDYEFFNSGMNLLAIHKDDPTKEYVTIEEKKEEEVKPT